MRICAILNGGGHTAETLALVEKLHNVEPYYMVDAFDHLTISKVKKNRKLYVLSPRKRNTDSKIISGFRLVLTMILTSLYFMRYRFRAVVAVGGTLTVPVMFLARFCRIKTMFVESVARVYTLSMSGHILYGKVDVFAVQWVTLAKQLKRSVYGGIVL